jgi:3D (Asp-Asp-Asp) domain-containing protein
MPSRAAGLVLAFLIVLAPARSFALGQARHTKHRAKPPRPFVATAYCRGRETATGVRVHEGIAAADPDVFPMGTRIRVSDARRHRLGTYRVMDTGRKIQGRRVDLYVESCARARRFGRKPVHITIVN